MNPNNPSQYQGPVSQDPQHKNTGAWDFLNNVEPPMKQSFFSRYKKVLIIAGSAFGLLIILAVIASVSGGGSTKKASNLPGSTTNVAMSPYDKEAFSMQYPSDLAVALDEKNDNAPGWFMLFREDKDSSDYELSVSTGNEASIYADGTDAVTELLDEGVEPTNIVTSDVVMAGQKSQKTIGEFTGSDDRQYNVVYANTQVGSQYITVSGKYLKEKQNLTDAFDAMLGSIKLK